MAMTKLAAAKGSKVVGTKASKAKSKRVPVGSMSESELKERVKGYGQGAKTVLGNRLEALLNEKGTRKYQVLKTSRINRESLLGYTKDMVSEALRAHKAGNSSMLDQILDRTIEVFKKEKLNIAELLKKGKGSQTDVLAASLNAAAVKKVESSRFGGWLATASSTAIEIFDLLTPHQKELFSESKYYRVITKNHELDSEALQDLAMTEFGGISLQTRRLMDFCEKYGIHIPREIVSKADNPTKSKEQIRTESPEQMSNPFNKVRRVNDPGGIRF